MPNKDSAWKEFELLIAEIERQLAPDAIVKHNQQVKGLISGRRRQLDITVSQKISMHPVFIVIECKRYKRPVTLEKVEAFNTKLADVGASQGVIVSTSGFDQGAIAAAKPYNIGLLSYHEAESVDWQRNFGEGAWARFSITETYNVQAAVVLADQTHEEVPLDSIVYNMLQEPLFTLQDFLNDQLTPKFYDVGPFTVRIDTNQPQYIEYDGQLREIKTFGFSGMYRAREYLINLAIAGGHIIQDEINQETVFSKLVTVGFNWEELVASHPYKELSSEEFRLNQEQPHISVPTTELQPFLRLEFNKQK